MRAGEPSRTAFGAAAHRAAHQVLEDGRVFHDPLAWRILGADRERVLESARSRPRPLRLFIAVRHRFAEDALGDAVRRGTRQAVVLGAGLDTFAYRNPHPGLEVFEVDHPDTGRWKRERLAAAEITAPETVRFVGVDFERDGLVDRLVEHGFDTSRAAFFLWLGVVPYLSLDAVLATLRAIAAVPGAEVVFDYPSPSGAGSRVREDLRRRTEAAGEPLRSVLDPAELAVRLRRLGYDEVEDLGRPEILSRFLGVAADDAPGDGGGHVVLARRTARSNEE